MCSPRTKLYAINVLARGHGLGVANALLERSVGDRAVLPLGPRGQRPCRRLLPSRHGFAVRRRPQAGAGIGLLDLGCREARSGDEVVKVARLDVRRSCGRGGRRGATYALRGDRSGAGRPPATVPGPSRTERGDGRRRARAILLVLVPYDDLPDEALPTYGVAKESALRNAETRCSTAGSRGRSDRDLGPPRARPPRRRTTAGSASASALPADDADLLRLWAWSSYAARSRRSWRSRPNAVSIRLHRARRKLADELRKVETGAGHEGSTEGRDS